MLGGGGKDVWAAHKLPFKIDMKEQTKGGILLHYRRSVQKFPDVWLTGVRADGTVGVRFRDTTWEVPAGKRLPLPGISRAWPVSEKLPYEYRLGRVGNQVAIRFTVKIDVVNHGLISIDTQTIKRRRQ